jgi:hypothetical protein
MWNIFLKASSFHPQPNSTWEGKYRSTDNRKIGKERGHSYRTMKRSPDKRHTQTLGTLIEIFR